MVFQQFNDTFVYVGDEVGTKFEIHPFVSDRDFLAAAGSFDFFYGGPTLIYCVILANNVQPLATLVFTVRGKPVSVLSGSLVVPAGSNLTTLADIRGKAVATGQFTGLTTFQSELYLLVQNNISLFTETKALLGYSYSPSILQAVWTGVADVGFIQTMPFPPNLSVVGGMSFPNQELPSSTPPYSSQVFAAAKAIPNDMRTKVTEALLSIGRNRPDILQAANYSGWGVPQSFIDIRRLGQATGLLSPGGEKCADLGQAYSFIKCPDGYARMSDSSLAGNCARRGYTCPPDVSCICSPCVRIIPPKMIGALSVGTFWAILVSVTVTCTLLLAIFFLRRRHRVKFIPWRAIDVDPSDVLGQTSKGLVLKGRYKNRWVACKRAYPRIAAGVSIFDSRQKQPVEVTGLRTLVHFVGIGQGVASFFGIPTGLSRRGRGLTDLISQDHPNVLNVLGATRGADGYELVAVCEFPPRGTLQDLLDNRSIDIPAGSLLKLALDVARGLAFLHSLDRPRIGTKLTASSVYISDSFECKLSPDVYDREHTDTTKSLTMAPEVLRGGKPTLPADMYSFGMLLYHIVHRAEPFAGCDVAFVTRGVCDLTADEIVRPVITEHNLPADVCSFMQRCWDDEPDLRPVVQDALNLLMPYANLSLGGSLTMEGWNQRALLQQILPDHVLKALREGRTPSSRTFDMVTVFFSDIKGFTDISSSETPEGVMLMLDGLYRKFDALCTKHGLMKVETIGDAYMLVGGMKGEKDHAARVGRFALEAVCAAHTVKLPGGIGTVKIRAGFHSGPVVSGVVGTEVPRYCLFGDTVNTASRMESTGVVDRIQMSGKSAGLVKEQGPDLSNRVYSRAGFVTPKGKSPMQTFWLFTDADMEKIQTRSSPAFKRRSETMVTFGGDEVVQLALRPRQQSVSLDLSRPTTIPELVLV